MEDYLHWVIFNIYIWIEISIIYIYIYWLYWNCIKNLLRFKIWLHIKATWIKKILRFKNCLSWKIVCKENFLYWKNVYIEIFIYIEKLLVHWTTYIENLLRFQILVILKNHFKHSKRGNHKKYGIRSFQIYG